MGLSLGLDLPDLDAPTANHFTIRFKPEQELFATGNEPLMLLRNLCDLGTSSVRCNLTDLPALEDLAPETPYIEWLIELETEAAEPEIRDIFEFVDGLCEIEITGAAPEPGPTDIAPCRRNCPRRQSLRQPFPKRRSRKSPPSGDGWEIRGERAREGHRRGPQGRCGCGEIRRAGRPGAHREAGELGRGTGDQSGHVVAKPGRGGPLPHSDAMNGLEEFQRLTRDIQDSVMMIRAQPVKSLFQRMSRIVREASAAVDKDVRLITEGEGTEVDKTVIERLSDPLTHMIRNAVDHGLEGAADREKAGKPRAGTVKLTAAHRSGRVIIEVADDGAGINRKRVQEIAVSKGLIPPEIQLSDSEIDNLLFLPGFSTAKTVSNLSGRGVGMDVVKTAIQSLGGRITINSEPNKGTTFSISLPLTLAVLDGMVVNVAGETLVLPLNVVVETLSLGPDDVQMLRPGHYVVRVRGGFVPLYDLGVMLGYRQQRKTEAGVIVLLIVLEDSTRAALVIDGIQDQRQVVIKGLDDSFYRAPGIAAATILGDGQIALILDPADVIAGMGQMRGADLMLSERMIANE